MYFIQTHRPTGEEWMSCLWWAHSHLGCFLSSTFTSTGISLHDFHLKRSSDDNEREKRQNNQGELPAVDEAYHEGSQYVSGRLQRYSQTYSSGLQ